MPKLSWMTLARGARQLVVQEALLSTKRHTVGNYRHTVFSCQNMGLKWTNTTKLKFYNSGVCEKANVMIPDNGHGGGIVFVLINSHNKHWSIRRRCRNNHTLSSALDVSLELSEKRERGQKWDYYSVFVSVHVFLLVYCVCVYIPRPSPHWGRLQWTQQHT